MSDTPVGPPMKYEKRGAGACTGEPRGTLGKPLAKLLSENIHRVQNPALGGCFDDVLFLPLPLGLAAVVRTAPVLILQLGNHIARVCRLTGSLACGSRGPAGSC